LLHLCCVVFYYSYTTKYCSKSGASTTLLNEMIEYLTQRSIDVLPPNMKQVLSHLVLTDCAQRAFMSKPELSYKVMNLPAVRRTFADVSVVGFYRRANLIESREDGSTIVYSDRTEYSAYAERCRQDSEIVNAKSIPVKLTQDGLSGMNFREFAEMVHYRWSQDPNVTAEPIDEERTRKFMTRNINSGHWTFSLRRKRQHIRYSTVLYTEPAHLYKPVEEGETTTQTSFFSLSAEKRNQLYRSYMELVCYVPWKDSPEESFLDAQQRAKLEAATDDPEKDHRYSLRRLEMFFQEYKRMYVSLSVFYFY